MEMITVISTNSTAPLSVKKTNEFFLFLKIKFVYKDVIYIYETTVDLLDGFETIKPVRHNWNLIATCCGNSLNYNSVGTDLTDQVKDYISSIWAPILIENYSNLDSSFKRHKFNS